MILKLDYVTFEYNQLYNIFSNLLSPYLASNNSITNNMTPTNTIPNTYSQVAIPNISFMATSKILSTIFQTKEGIVKYPFVTLQLRPQSVVDAGGAYDYASAQNANIKVSFFNDSAFLSKLFNQNIPIRVQNDNATLELNIWQYSYQELNLIRDVIQRAFALSRRIFQPIDLTPYILPSILSSGLDIDQQLLTSFNVSYNLPIYFSLQSATDTTPTTITNQIPLIKFTYQFTIDSWVPTDVEIQPITTLINEITIFFNTLAANNQIGSLDEIADIQADFSTTPPTIKVYYDKIQYLQMTYEINNMMTTNLLSFVGMVFGNNNFDLISAIYDVVIQQNILMQYNIQPVNALITFNYTSQTANTTNIHFVGDLQYNDNFNIG